MKLTSIFKPRTITLSEQDIEYNRKLLFLEGRDFNGFVSSDARKTVEYQIWLKKVMAE